MAGPYRPTRMAEAAVALLEIFIVAVVAALAITLASVPPGVKAFAGVAVIPILAVSFVLIYYCRKGKVWGFAGACILGAVGVALRLVVNTQPSLEVGGGLPIGVTALYIVLGVLVSITNFAAYMELRPRPGRTRFP